MRRLLWAACLVSLMAIGTGCSDSSGPGDGPRLGVRASPTTVKPLWLITLTLTIDRFVLEPPIWQPNEAGHGHLQVYLDDEPEDNFIALGWDSTQLQFNMRPNTPPGAHFIRVELYNNDFSRLSPRVFKKIDITVQ
jgi:hypothetical protein